MCRKSGRKFGQVLRKSSLFKYQNEADPGPIPLIRINLPSLFSIDYLSAAATVGSTSLPNIIGTFVGALWPQFSLSPLVRTVSSLWLFVQS